MVAFRFQELHPELGVEIAGLDLSEELDAESIATLRDLFDRRGLLLLRGAGFTPDEQAYLVGVVIGQTVPTDRAAAIALTHAYANYVTNKDEDGYARFGELLFHCDMMWAETPIEVISLYGRRVDPPTVPTRFASMGSAFATLPADSAFAGRRAQSRPRDRPAATGSPQGPTGCASTRSAPFDREARDLAPSENGTGIALRVAADDRAYRGA